MTLITKKYLKNKFPGNHAMQELIDYIDNKDERAQLMDPAEFEKVGIRGYLNSEYFVVQTYENGKTIITPIITTTTVIIETPGGDTDGVNVTFTITQPPNIYSIRVYLNGVRQHPDDYAIDGNTLVFVEPPEAGDIIQIFYDIFSATEAVNAEIPTGDIDGENTDFVLANIPDPVSLNVFLNGILQKNGTDFTVSVATISFVNAPYAGDWILIDYYTVTSAASGTYNITPTGDIDGVNADFTLAESPEIVKVYLNGVLQLQDTDYTFATNTITFTVPPETGDWIIVDYK
jgi:hypothetical protein